MKRKAKTLTPRQYAEQQGVAYTTVMSWLQRGKLPGAVKHATLTGHYWELLETVSAPKLQPGRPPKADGSNGVKEGSKEMIEDKATERWKERAKKLGLIVNAGADNPQSKPKTSGPDGKVSVKPGKQSKK